MRWNGVLLFRGAFPFFFPFSSTSRLRMLASVPIVSGFDAVDRPLSTFSVEVEAVTTAVPPTEVRCFFVGFSSLSVDESEESLEESSFAGRFFEPFVIGFVEDDCFALDSPGSSSEPLLSESSLEPLSSSSESVSALLSTLGVVGFF